MPKEDFAIVSVRLPVDLKRALDKLAAADRRTLTNYINLILEDHVASQKGRVK